MSHCYDAQYMPRVCDGIAYWADFNILGKYFSCTDRSLVEILINTYFIAFPKN